MTTANNSHPVLHRLRALIVEDDPADAELIVSELRRSGFEVLWERVETEEQYLAKLAGVPEIVLADYSLPQFNGSRALELLQQQGIAIPFVVVSGTVGEEAAARIIRQGATEYVLKNRLAALGPAVTRALQGNRNIAYFSMEIALESAMPTYSGGLGVLAGDTLRSAADMRVPMVAVTLLHRAGHFLQQLDESGSQSELPVDWKVDSFLTEMPVRAAIQLEQRNVSVRCWKYQVEGVAGYSVPVYLLDTDLPENSDWDRKLTSILYGGDSHYRLQQEIVLGVGGVRILRALGYKTLDRYHMNEGHASLLTLELLLELLLESARKAGRTQIDASDLAAVRQRCIFTTHTPVPAGHDQFPLSALGSALGFRPDLTDICEPQIAVRIFGRHEPRSENQAPAAPQTMLNMTYLGLNMSRYVNGVAKKHGQVSRLMFAGYHIDAITNGVHAATWTSPAFQSLYDSNIPDWRQDNFTLRHAESIPRKDVWDAHMRAKTELLDCVNKHGTTGMDADVFTVGFARRVTAYKRADLVFSDIERLKKIANEFGGLQFVYAGKAHPSDNDGKQLIRRIVDLKRQLKGQIAIAFLPNYDVELAKLITAGVDLWLNTPQPPLEASGTSGMKAALNGIPSLSVLDGWWLEGLVDGVTGWAIGDEKNSEKGSRSLDAACLYERLEGTIVPMFYHDRERFIEIMRHASAINGSHFNTQRMLHQYVSSAYLR